MIETSKSKLLVAGGLLFLLGVLLTIFSIYHTKHMGAAYLQYPLFLYGSTILSLALGGFIVYLFQAKINTLQLERLLTILPPTEKAVLRILVERREVEQNRLVTLSGLSTVKVSRTLATLEQRGIIERKKQGYTNLVILKL